MLLLLMIARLFFSHILLAEYGKLGSIRVSVSATHILPEENFQTRQYNISFSFEVT